MAKRAPLWQIIKPFFCYAGSHRVTYNMHYVQHSMVEATEPSRGTRRCLLTKNLSSTLAFYLLMPLILINVQIVEDYSFTATGLMA